MQRKIIALIITAAISCFSAFTSPSLRQTSLQAASASKGTTVSAGASSAEGSQTNTAGTISPSCGAVSEGNCDEANSGSSACNAKSTAPSKQAETSGSITSSTAGGTRQNNSAASSSKTSSRSSCSQTASQPSCSRTASQPSCSRTASQPSCSQNASRPTVSQTPSQPASSQTASSSPSASGYTSFQNEVVRLVNVERAKNSLSALTADSLLMKTATVKSQDMASNNYFSHTSPTYGSPFDLMKKMGVTYRSAGENIAMGQTSPAQVMDGWMNSSGHRANILNSSYTKIGVGVVQNSSGRYYWTQHFTG